MTTHNATSDQFPLDGLAQYLSPEWSETNLPERGPDCPLTLDLMLAVLNRSWESDSALKQHVDACPRCAPRLQALEQAVNAPHPVDAPKIREQYYAAPAVPERRVTWAGHFPDPEWSLASEGILPPIDRLLNLVLLGERHSSIAFHARLHFSINAAAASNAKAAAPQSWKVSIHLVPHDPEDKSRVVSPEELSRLNNVAVRVTLKTREPVDFYCAQTRLDIDTSVNTINTQPVVLNIENPYLIESVELIEMGRLRGYDET